MPDSHAQQRAWALIARAPRLDAAQVRALLREFGDVAALPGLPVAGLRAFGLLPAAARLIADPPAAAIDADLAWLARSGAWLLPCTAAGYPSQLAEVVDAPAVLYGLGQASALHAPQLAMVGSRNPTAAGQRTATDFAHALAQAGLAITSGLAKGIDAASHAGALAAGGRTIAVCGTGLDQVYPPEHAGLAERIAAQGALVSEFPPGTAPVPGNFPRRNRIISGLSRGTLVVEAARGSGSLITAREALDQGRTVFAIPGSIHSPLSRGCHQLLRQGAVFVEEVGDVLREVGIPLENLLLSKQPVSASNDAPAGGRQLDKDYEMLLDALGFEPASIDDLVDRTGLGPPFIASMLLILELEGRIEPQPGARYCRVPHEGQVNKH